MPRPGLPEMLSVPGHDDVVADALLDRAIARAWEALLPDSDGIADVITTTIFENDPDWYSSADDSLLADIRQSTRDHIRRGITEMAGHRDPEHRTTDLWRETGRRRARQGVPLELVLNAYTLGSRVLWEALLGLGTRSASALDDRALVVAGRRLWHSLHVQNAVLIEAFRRESSRMTRRDLQRQQSSLDGLIEGRGADPVFAGDAADVLGVGADVPLACVAALVEESLDEPLRSPDDRLERAGRMSSWHVRGGVQVGLVPMDGLDVQDLADHLRPGASGRVGIALADEGLRGFASAYQLAVRAAQTLQRSTPGVVVVTDRLPEVLLSASPDITSLLVEESIGPLLALSGHLRETLLDTLATLLRCNVSHSRAAEHLYCHRNTVIYRQRQIETLTGRDLKVPRDRLLLSLGLMATGRIASGPPPGPPDGASRNGVDSAH